jgi:hypothetical protein
VVAVSLLLHGSIINRFLAEVRDATVQVVPVDRTKDEDREEEPGPDG